MASLIKSSPGRASEKLVIIFMYFKGYLTLHMATERHTDLKTLERKSSLPV